MAGGGYSVTFTVVDNATKQIDAINRRIAAMRAPMERMSKQVSKFVDVTGLSTIAKGFTAIGRSVLSVVSAMTDLVPVLGAVTGAGIIAGITRLVTSTASWAQHLQMAADNTDTPTQKLQQFENAVRLAGGSAEDADKAIQGLYDATAAFVRSGGTADPQVTGWISRLGINVKDANGQLRSAAELAPEFVKKISELPTANERAAASAALFADKSARLVNIIRESGSPIEKWIADAEKYAGLSKQEIADLEAFNRAQQAVGVSFDTTTAHAGASISKYVTPLLKSLSEFMDKHQKQINDAIDTMGAKFNELAKNMPWLDMAKQIERVLDDLGSLTKSLQEATGYVKPLFEWLDKITKWQNDFADFQRKTFSGITGATPGGPGAAPSETNPEPQPTARPHSWFGPGGWLDRQLGLGSKAAPAPTSVPFSGTNKEFYDKTYSDLYDAAKAKNLPHPEVVAKLGASQASLETGYGKHFVGNNLFGIKAGGGVGTGSVDAATTEVVNGQTVNTSAKFASFENTKDASAAYVDFLTKNQRYANVIGAANDQAALSAIGSSGYATDPAYQSKLTGIETTYGPSAPPAAVPASAPPASVPPPAPVKGSVDVAITGKNLPPDSAVTAQGTGAVNVPPPRVEYQSLSSV